MSLTVRGQANLILMVFMVLYVAGKTPCILPSPLTLQMVLEYAEWRSWSQVVLFDNVSRFNCALNYVRPLMQCFGKKGISVSLHSATNPNIPDILTVRMHRVGSIVLLDGLNLTSPDNVIQMASQKYLYNYYIPWFMVTSRNTDSSIDTILRDLNIGIDSDVVVATSPLLNDAAATKYIQKYKNNTCSSLRRYSKRFKFIGPSEGRKVENATMNLSYVGIENEPVSFYLVHTYKIRNADNTSLVNRYLGFWNPGTHTLQLPVSVKLRNNLNGLPMIFGLLNGTNDGQTDTRQDKRDETETNDITPLLDFATFITSSINATMEIVTYEKLGILNNKVWSNLLGDVVAGTVDIGLGYITINEERLGEMAFSHPLVRYMRNIYYHPLETGTMRDIFLQPFNNRLLGCVAATYFILLLAMTTIIYAAKRVMHEDEYHVGFGEATLWCISIMCMQGSPWIPHSSSGQTLQLFSLMFALVTYSAYAGFITSILSVQATGIKSINDLLFNNFKLGYSISDDEYIRDVNDSNLRQLYIKAFNSRESRLDTTSGLIKAVQGRYAFFVSATLARRALKTTLIQERCNLMELTLPQTFTVVALPMANSCPYKKIINLNILRIQERGVLAKIAEEMLPDMPSCIEPTTFHSARLADVYSAFFIVTAGLIVAASIGIVERLWNKRKQMRETIVRTMRQHHLIPNIRFHHRRRVTQAYLRSLFKTSIRRCKMRGYDHAYLNMLENHIRQVAFIGLKHDTPKNSLGLEPRFQLRRRSTVLKRVSWSSSSDLPKRIRAERNLASNMENNPVFPFQN